MTFDKMTHENQKGFTLVEIAIVLVIVGLLVGMGANLIGPLTKRVKVHETKEIVNAAVESVIGSGASSNLLPDAAAFPTIVRKSDDVWSSQLIYIYDSSLTGSICGRTTTNLSVNDCSDDTCSSFVTINNVAFIIFSESENFNNQTAAAGAASSAVNVYDYGLNVDNYSGDGATVEPYDDIVKWITLGELIIKADCSGTRLKILNNELPYVKRGDTYSATVYADGGVPYGSGGQYRWCRQESPPSDFTFTPSTLNTDCLNLTESSWLPSNNLVISGSHSSSSGSFNVTFFVRDDNDSSGSNDNIAQKSFVITVNPIP